MASYYLNTDLDLHSRKPFDQVMIYFESKAEVLHYEKHQDDIWYGTVEAAGSGERDSRNPEVDIRSLLDVIKSFDPRAKDEWKGMTSIDFNIGWQAASIRPEGRFELPTAILSDIALIGGSISSTIYPSSENDDEDAEQGAQPDAFGAG